MLIKAYLKGKSTGMFRNLAPGVVPNAHFGLALILWFRFQFIYIYICYARYRNKVLMFYMKWLHEDVKSSCAAYITTRVATHIFSNHVCKIEVNVVFRMCYESLSYFIHEA